MPREGSEGKEAAENSWSGHSSKGTGGCQGPGDRCCHRVPRGGGEEEHGDTGQRGLCWCVASGEGDLVASLGSPGPGDASRPLGAPSTALSAGVSLLPSPWGSPGQGAEGPTSRLSLILQGCENPHARAYAGGGWQGDPNLEDGPCPGTSRHCPETISVAVTTNGSDPVPKQHRGG